MDEVRRALVVGTLRAEDPMPSVRELASQLVVNPRTVSQGQVAIAPGRLGRTWTENGRRYLCR